MIIGFLKSKTMFYNSFKMYGFGSLDLFLSLSFLILFFLKTPHMLFLKLTSGRFSVKS